MSAAHDPAGPTWAAPGVGSKLRNTLLACLALSFAFSLLAGVLPRDLLAGVASVVDLAPGLRALARSTGNPEAASVSLAVSLVLGLAMGLVCLLAPIPQVVVRQRPGRLPRRQQVLLALVGLLLLGALVGYEPAPAGPYRFAYLVEKLFAASHVAFAVFCAGMYLFVAGYFLALRSMFGRAARPTG